MSGQQVALLLQECLRRAGTGPEGDTQPRRAAEGAGPAGPYRISVWPFPGDLSTLLQEAKDRKWPFVEEKWQYKQSVTPEDKINSSDLVRKHLLQLLAFLRDSISSEEPEWAVAVVFLLDRLLYWMDGSHLLLKIAKALHKRHRDVPIAPQVIIRQARVYLNTGKLQKAELILSSLISSASTGSWTYQKFSDQTLVQAVGLQVRGQVLQTLGLWLEAAELIWASLIGFYTLPQPDKKVWTRYTLGIGTSLGLLANTLTSMNDRDFTALQEKPHIDLGFLGESGHRLLSAARAAKMAVVFSQYGSLYVLTNVVAQGICLLSYSFSKKCPAEDQQTYLALAKEAFEIGLLTKTTGDVVTSKLELHTFLKASYCLAVAHRWMLGPSETTASAMSVCREAMTLFIDYCARGDSASCTKIMAKIQQIKLLLKVKTFRNSDPQSFIPDIYRSMEFGPVLFTLGDFAKALDVFGKHHQSVCEAFENGARRGSCSNHARCITAFQTDTEVLATQMQKDDHSRPFDPSGSGSSLYLADTEQSSLGSYELVDDFSSGSIINPSNQSSASPSVPNTFRNNSGNPSQSQLMQKLATSEDVEDILSKKSNTQHKGNQKNAKMSSSSFSSGSSWERVSRQSQSSIETEGDIEDPSHEGSHARVSCTKGGSTSAHSLCDSSASRSSWQKLSISPIANGEHLEHHSQSSIETEEDIVDAFHEGNDARVSRTKGGSTSSFSLCDSSASRSSWQKFTISPIANREHLEHHSQSSIETEEDIVDASNEGNDARVSRTKGGSTSSFSLCDSSASRSSWQKLSISPIANREHLEHHSQSSIETEEDIVDASHEGSHARVSRTKEGSTSAHSLCDSSASRSSWQKLSISPIADEERLEHHSQSSIETEEELIDLSHSSREINNDAKVGCTKGGSTSSFSLCDSSASRSSWQKLSIANVEQLELTHTKERTDQRLEVPDKIPECPGTLSSTESDPFEELGFEHLSTASSPCKDCFKNCIMGSDVLTERDYRSLLAGACQRCLLERLPNKALKPLDPIQLEKAYDAVVLKYSRAADVWIGSESSVYVGKLMGVQGKQRRAIEVQYLHQEQLLSSYVGKEYLKAKGLHAHLDDVERQMTAQYYVTEFNKRLYDNNVTTQIFFIPSEVLLILEKDRIVTCLSAEPYMSGTFVKLTNNTRDTDERHDATKYGIAFGHFTYEFSAHQEVVVDLQGWITANGKGLTYLTDPQIHSLLKPRSSNFQQTGIDNFIRHQHGDQCNEICRAAGLAHIGPTGRQKPA
ncbi:alpha-protein kinase 1-like [Puntigrus tetrazona]|uniref:alpha-protein kinase 1-like n=1 Tax=Puntigrus tetrazona TaxID=1606681 RepID=UPI001C892BBD|nr:alpha-protein kinase 1-like [Puntigrus tetrazona]